MSKLLKAITDLLGTSQGSARKGKKSESLSRGEFKRLIQQEFAPVKRSPTSKFRIVPRSPDSDTEPMARKERGKSCGY